jgi:hypothetical protein
MNMGISPADEVWADLIVSRFKAWFFAALPHLCWLQTTMLSRWSPCARGPELWPLTLRQCARVGFEWSRSYVS